MSAAGNEDENAGRSKEGKVMPLTLSWLLHTFLSLCSLCTLNKMTPKMTMDNPMALTYPKVSPIITTAAKTVIR